MALPAPVLAGYLLAVAVGQSEPGLEAIPTAIPPLALTRSKREQERTSVSSVRIPGLSAQRGWSLLALPRQVTRSELLKLWF